MKEDLKARKAAVEARRATRGETEQDRRDRLDVEFLEKLDELEAEHGHSRVRGIRTDLGGIFVRAPSPPAFRAWRASALDEQASGGSKYESIVAFAQSGCILHPDPATLEMWSETLAGVYELAADAAVGLSGRVEVSYQKK